MNCYRLISLVAVSILVIACQPATADVTEEPVTSEPTTELTAPPTQEAASTPTSTPTTAVTEEPGTVPPIDYGPVSTLDPATYLAPSEGCVFLPPGEGESVMSPLMQPAWTEQVYSGVDPRFIMGCYYLTEDNFLILRVWVPDTVTEAQDDYNSRLQIAADEAVMIEGLGDSAYWWPRLLRLEALRGNAWLSITFGKPVPDAANAAARLAALALPSIDPSLGAITPPQVSVPQDAPVPEVVTDPARMPEFFEACSLVTEQELEQVIGSLQSEPLSGSSIGEMVGTFYDCVAGSASSSLYYTIFYAGSPSAAFDHFYREEAATVDPSYVALPIDGVGDEARFWRRSENEYTAQVLRSSLVVGFSYAGEPSPDTEEQIRTFVALVIERLLERLGVSR